MKIYQKQFWFACAFLVCAAIACNFPLSSPEPTPIPVSQEQAKALEQQVIQSLTQVAQTGTFSLEITDSQLTSAMAISLTKEAANIGVPLENVQVRFTEGKIFLSASTVQGVFKVPVEIVAKVEAVSCQVQFTVESANAGPLPLPKEQLNSLVPQAQNALFEQITSTLGANVCITSLIVGDGRLAVSGQKIP